MISMQGVSSALIARNESWVRKQAGAMMRRLPSNVEKADLIQVGLIAVAQAAMNFKWPGDPDSEASKEAFVRYARLRVKGAMIDELRQMDHLGRAQRRKIKVIQIARERWHAQHGAVPSLLQLQQLSGIPLDEISQLDHAAQMAQAQSLSDDDSQFERSAQLQPATAQDEVEARVDTAIVMRRLERFVATLPERERQVIDAYLGVGLSPTQLAGDMQVSVSRVSQIFKASCRRIATHLGSPEPRALDRQRGLARQSMQQLVSQRETEQARQGPAGAWGQLLEKALTAPPPEFGALDDQGHLHVDDNTRWG